jgi:hypothetical protein
VDREQKYEAEKKKIDMYDLQLTIKQKHLLLDIEVSLSISKNISIIKHSLINESIPTGFGIDNVVGNV